MVVAQRTRPPGFANHEIRDPADAALELTLRKAASEGRRICVVCAEEKPLEDFPKSGRGRSYRCRDCAIRAAEKIGEKPAPPDDNAHTPADAREVAEEAAESAERVAGIARGVTALNDAIRGAQGPAEDESDPDVEHAELLDPAVAESIKRFVRGTVKGTAALMVRDLVKAAVREAAAAIVPELVTEALTVEMRKYPVPAAVAAETSQVRETEMEEPGEEPPGEEPPALPALVTALLERQPLHQRGWGCATERARWLAAFNAVLDIVFPITDGADGEEVRHGNA